MRFAAQCLVKVKWLNSEMFSAEHFVVFVFFVTHAWCLGRPQSRLLWESRRCSFLCWSYSFIQRR